MMQQFDQTQKLVKDNMDAAMKAAGALSKSAQAIAAETATYAKKAFEDHSSNMEKLMAVKSPEKAIEIQTDYMRSAYEGFVAQSTKLGTLYADLAKEVFKPFEGVVANVSSPAKSSKAA